MSQEHDDVLKQHAPDKLLRGFSTGNMMMWLALAVILHVALIVGTSIGYIRDTWIDPEGAAVRKQEAAQALRDAAKAAAGVTNETAAVTTPSPVATNAPVAAPAKPLTEEERLRAERMETPVMKEINATATTNEIPKVPDDLGLSIRDIKVK
jgi:hypothetical protein